MECQVNVLKIENYIKENELSLNMFREKCGIGDQTLKNVLRGKANVLVLSKIAKAMDVNIFELMT